MTKADLVEIVYEKSVVSPRRSRRHRGEDLRDDEGQSQAG